jgi:hypothetical protein
MESTLSTRAGADKWLDRMSRAGFLIFRGAQRSGVAGGVQRSVEHGATRGGRSPLLIRRKKKMCYIALHHYDMPVPLLIRRQRKVGYMALKDRT